MSKCVVAYFSVSKTTKMISEKIANICEMDLCEITPKTKYTVEDLDWTNPNSRSSVEMKDLNCRPEIECIKDLNEYDTVLVGFPIWWGREPSVVDTFLSGTNLANKNVVVFATSGGSGIENAVSRFKELLPNSNVVGLDRIPADIADEDLKNKLNSLSL